MGQFTVPEGRDEWRKTKTLFMEEGFLKQVIAFGWESNKKLRSADEWRLYVTSHSVPVPNPNIKVAFLTGKSTD